MAGNVTGNATGISEAIFILALTTIDRTWTNQPPLRTLPND